MFVTAGTEGSLRVWNCQDNFSPVGVYYSPVNRMGFVQDGVCVGEATGNKKILCYKV